MIWLGSKVNSVSFSPTQAYSVLTLLENNEPFKNMIASVYF